MRFNDLLRTVLAHGGEGHAAAVTRWRQCIDLVAQYDVSGARSAHGLSDEDAHAVFEVLADMCKRLGAEQRVSSIVELGNRLRSPRLCRFLAQDHPAVVTAVMTRARLVDEDWAAIIPSIGPLARSILRRRPDMESMARVALARFGPTDMTLPSSPAALNLSPANDAPPRGRHAAPVKPAGETSEIRKIVERIEQFTATRQPHDNRPVGAAPLDLAVDQMVAQPDDAIDSFTFETDEKGRFGYVQGAPRAAVVGLTVGAPAFDALSGADGQALGAYRRRAAFRDARFAIANGTLAGEWRISAEPRFDRASGLFRGYSGSARRELAHEKMVRAGGIGGDFAVAVGEGRSGVGPSVGGSGVARSGGGGTSGSFEIGNVIQAAHEVSSVMASAGSGGIDWSGLSASGARQLIHELRTPLSAIYAYAEMIEGQLVGPVSSEYRGIATQIISDARELVATFDDLDLAGQIARNEERGGADVIDLASQLRVIVLRFSQSGGHRITLETVDELPSVSGDREQIERMLTHLVRAGYTALGDEEPLLVRMRFLPVTGTISVAIRRPAALRDHSETMLLDHASPIDHMFNDAPPLGLAFALRLVRGIAGRMGGQLLLSEDAFELILPAVTQGESGRERGS